MQAIVAGAVAEALVVCLYCFAPPVAFAQELIFLITLLLSIIIIILTLIIKTI
jgi:hypothetical protein